MRYYQLLIAAPLILLSLILFIPVIVIVLVLGLLEECISFLGYESPVKALVNDLNKK